MKLLFGLRIADRRGDAYERPVNRAWDGKAKLLRPLSAVAVRTVPEMIAEPMTQAPGGRWGARPPATPKLTTPRQYSSFVRVLEMALASMVARLRPSPLQMTLTPGPAAIRASNASPTTIIKRAPNFSGATHFCSQLHRPASLFVRGGRSRYTNDLDVICPGFGLMVFHVGSHREHLMARRQQNPAAALWQRGFVPSSVTPSHGKSARKASRPRRLPAGADLPRGARHRSTSTIGRRRTASRFRSCSRSAGSRTP